MKESLTDLFRNLLGEIRTLLRQEVQLAKTEMSEKASRLGRNAMLLAIGGSAAYAGALVLLTGFGLLLAWAFVIAGVPLMLAGFLGLGLIGLLVAGGGGLLLFKALRTLSKESLVPQKSVEALQHFKEIRSRTQPSAETNAGAEFAPKPKLSSEELQNATFATEETLENTLNELKRRLSPRQIKARMTRRLASHPYRAGAIALAAGLVSTLLVRRRFRHA